MMIYALQLWRSVYFVTIAYFSPKCHTLQDALGVGPMIDNSMQSFALATQVVIGVGLSIILICVTTI